MCETVRFYMHTMRGVIFSVIVNLFDNDPIKNRAEISPLFVDKHTINISLNYLLVKDKDIHLLLK